MRKLVAAMVLHARGKISLADIEDVLDNPRRDFWYSGQLDMAETGLFLREVEYLSEGKLTLCDSGEFISSCSTVVYSLLFILFTLVTLSFN